MCLERKRNINQFISWMMVICWNRGMEMSQSRSHTPDPLSPDRQQQQQVQSPASRGPGPSPTMQQRIKAIGVPTPLAMSSPIRRLVSPQCSGAGVYNLSCLMSEFSLSDFFPSVSVFIFFPNRSCTVFSLVRWNFSCRSIYRSVRLSG
jgi:hypothetical protein